MRHRLAIVLLVLAAAAAASGCKPALIPNTEIRDTEENREIMRVVERYRQAMEQRDMDSLRPLISPRYYENASSTGDQSDDWGFPDLDAVLGEVGGSLRAVTYDLKVTAIDVEGDRAEVKYEYTWNFQYFDGDAEGWARKSDVNRLSLLREEGTWRFVAGL